MPMPGDTTTIQQTLIAVAEQMEKLTENDETAGQIAENWLAELVTDKGYHSNETMVDLQEFKIRSYISEPKRGRRNWTGARQQNAMPFMPIAGGFEASAAKAYYVVVGLMLGTAICS